MTDAPATPPVAATFTGTIVRVTFRNEENGYCVLKVRPESLVEGRWQQPGGLVAVVGVMPGAEPGQTLLVGGEWIVDPKFGAQFKAEWFKPALPATARGIEVYLASGAIRGVGPVLAKRIVDHFGDRTLDVLDAEPARLSEIPGLRGRTLEKVLAGWRGAKGDRELITFLGEHGIAPGIAGRLRKVYGENALAVVRANPYRLMGDVRGIGFLRADEMARKIGLPEDAPERIAAALHHVLTSQSEDGHTCLPEEFLLDTARDLLGVDLTLVEQQLAAELATARLAREELAGLPRIALPDLRAAEQRIAERLRILCGSRKRLPKVDAVETLADFEQRTHFHLAGAQREAALMLAREGMLILTGGPGTGKTTTVRSIIELFTRSRLQVRLAAPTGRAARRLSETAKLPAETIHRLLGFQAHGGQFSRTPENPIEGDLLIVDEASMLDAPLAASLLAALPARACLLLVGDEDQLPSVGPGNVLGDLIAARALPLVRLTEVFRQAQASLIVTNAHRINQGQPLLDRPPTPEGHEDFFFIERETPGEIISTLRTLVCERIPRKFKLDPRHEVQILTPMRRGELGVEALNAELRAWLNPDPHAPPPRPAGSPAAPPRLEFEATDDEGALADTPRRNNLPRAGDRVMQISNNYDKNVFNGDIGRVTHVDADSREVHVAFDGRDVPYLSDELDQLTLAYATTIHKSQGSEYPAIVIPIHMQHWIMLQRNLIYTAVTRARRLVVVIGQRQALRRAIGNATRASRHTALQHYLKNDE